MSVKSSLISFGSEHEARNLYALIKNVCCCVFLASFTTFSARVQGSRTNPFTTKCLFQRCTNETSLLLSVSPPPPLLPPPFCLKSFGHVEEDAAVSKAMEKMEQLKTRRLKEYAVRSCPSTLHNNMCVSFERFVHVVEHIGLLDAAISEVAGANHALRRDVEALLSIYNDKGARYEEEGEAARKRLSQACCEFRQVEAARLLLQEDVKAVGASLEGVNGKFKQRQSQLDTLRQELDSGLQWLQELMESTGASKMAV